MSERESIEREHAREGAGERETAIERERQSGRERVNKRRTDRRSYRVAVHGAREKH